MIVFLVICLYLFRCWVVENVLLVGILFKCSYVVYVVYVVYDFRKS